MGNLGVYCFHNKSRNIFDKSFSFQRKHEKLSWKQYLHLISKLETLTLSHLNQRKICTPQNTFLSPQHSLTNQRRIPGIVPMCMQSLGVIFFTLQKKNKDARDEERHQHETPILPLKKSIPKGGLATPPKVVACGGSQQYGGKGITLSWTSPFIVGE